MQNVHGIRHVLINIVLILVLVFAAHMHPVLLPTICRFANVILAIQGMPLLPVQELQHPLCLQKLLIPATHHRVEQTPYVLTVKEQLPVSVSQNILAILM